MQRFTSTFRDVVFGPWAPSYDRMANAIDGTGSTTVNVYSLNGFARWDGTGQLAQVGEAGYRDGYDGALIAGYALMAAGTR